jgi:hypothetical protein
MQDQKKSLLTKFFIWRLKHISHKQFVYILSILVGFLSGVAAVLFKNFTHYIQLLLEGKLIKDYHTAFYFIFPLIGLLITYLLLRYVLRDRITQEYPRLFRNLKARGS